MDERLLIKCDSSIYADNISSVLEANNITVRRHVDESTDRRTGTHGPDSGTALYVTDKDYEKALEIIAPIADRMHEAIPFCPKCGSDNVTPIAPSRYTTAVIIASVILGLGSGFYPWWSLQLGIQSGTGSIIAGIFLLLAIFMAMSTKYLNANYRCRKCGRKFNHLASALILFVSITAAHAINPQKEYTYTPKDFGIEYVEDSVVTSDGYRINIWNLPGTGENGRSVLIACADAGNMGQWLGIGATLCFLGYDVWMFDYRGFGGSQDFATDRDMLYHSEYLRDGTIMVGEHLRQYPGRKSLIRSCVMDGFISDPAESVRILNGDNDNGSGSDGKSVQLPATPLLSPGFRPQDISVPMLLIHATEDTVSPRRLLEPLTTSPLVTLREFDCKHLQAAFTHTEEYFTALDTFLKAH